MYVCVWLCWVFVSVRGLSLVVASGGHSSSRCRGHSSSRPLLLRSTGSRRAGSVNVAHGPSCSAACGVFPDQGSNPCPPHWQADSQSLRHQGSFTILFFQCKQLNVIFFLFAFSAVLLVVSSDASFLLPCNKNPDFVACVCACQGRLNSSLICLLISIPGPVAAILRP